MCHDSSTYDTHKQAWKRKHLADHVIFAMETDLNALAGNILKVGCMHVFYCPFIRKGGI